MFIGRMGAIIYAKRKHQLKGIRRRRSEEELDKIKATECKLYISLLVETEIKDIDIKENTKKKLVFRKFPWAAWIMGLIFLGGALGTIYMIYEEFIEHRHRGYVSIQEVTCHVGKSSSL